MAHLVVLVFVISANRRPLDVHKDGRIVFHSIEDQLDLAAVIGAGGVLRNDVDLAPLERMAVVEPVVEEDAVNLQPEVISLRGNLTFELDR